MKLALLSCCSLFSRSVTSDSLWPHGLQQARLPRPSPSPGVCSNSCPLSQWCHPNISSTVDPFSSCLQSFPASGSFPMSWHFASAGQSIGASASASVLPVNIQGWVPIGLAGLNSLLPRGLSIIFSSTTILKHQFFSAQPSLWSNSHIHIWLLEKPQLWLYGPLSVRWCLCFLILSSMVIAFLPRSKCLLISWLQSTSAVILEPTKIKSVTVSVFPHLFAMGWGQMPWSSFSECWVLNQLCQSPLSPSSRGSLVLVPFLPLEWYHLHIWGCWYFLQQSWFQLINHPASYFAWCNLHIS